jgi:uncharacterized RDD family membrane protein YckC
MHNGRSYDDPDATTATPIVEPVRPRVVSVTVEPASVARYQKSPPIVINASGPLDIGNPLSYTLARGAAFAMDIAMVTFVVTTLLYALIAINPFTGLPANSQRGFDSTLLLGFIAACAYVIVGEGLFGTTLWKIALGLHVHAKRGVRVGLVRSFVRMLLVPLDLLLIGPLLALLPGHRRLGDLVGGTVVTRSKLSGFAQMLAILAIVVLFGLPWITVGSSRTFAGIFAGVEFIPQTVHLIWATVLGLVHH